MALQGTYFDPTYSHLNATGTTTGTAIDIGSATHTEAPPVLILTITGSATVLIEGSHDNAAWVDFSSGGYTTSQAKDLIIGVRFWRTRITVYASGLVTSAVGGTVGADGQIVMMNNAMLVNNISQN